MYFWNVVLRADVITELKQVCEALGGHIIIPRADALTYVTIG